MKFSECVTNLTELWLSWMQANQTALDKSLPEEERKQAAKLCEQLITLEYKLVAFMDMYFE